MRRGSQQRTHLRKLIHEAIPSTFEKCLEERAVKNWQPSVHQDILLACLALASLVTERMQVSVVTCLHAGACTSCRHVHHVTLCRFPHARPLSSVSHCVR